MKHMYRLSWDCEFFFETGKIALESSQNVVLQFFVQLFRWANIFCSMPKQFQRQRDSQQILQFQKPYSQL